MILDQLANPPAGNTFDDTQIIGAAGNPNITQMTIRSGDVLNAIQAVNTGTGPYNTGTQNTEDSVKLSQEDQVDQMALQGESASLIAIITGLSVGEIDNDLGISTSTSSIPVASSGGHGGGHPAAPVQAAAPAVASNVAPAGPTAT